VKGDTPKIKGVSLICCKGDTPEVKGVFLGRCKRGTPKMKGISLGYSIGGNYNEQKKVKRCSYEIII
jgi:hypothetical protein